MKQDLQIATLAGGCFWCLEAVYQEVDGIHSIVSGYCGGTQSDPTYEQVCSGVTGHAEAVNIFFDPDKVSYEKLLEIFFVIHDPTTLNRQGGDIGTQYRSAIFFHNDVQKQNAIKTVELLQNSDVWDSQIVTVKSVTLSQIDTKKPRCRGLFVNVIELSITMVMSLPI